MKYLFLFICGTLFAASPPMPPIVKPVTRTVDIGLEWKHSPDTNVVGYRIYYGAFSGNYTNSIQVEKTNRATVKCERKIGDIYFAATAFNDLGVESDFSNEVKYSFVVPTNTNRVIIVRAVLQVTNPAENIRFYGLFSGTNIVEMRNWTTEKDAKMFIELLTTD